LNDARDTAPQSLPNGLSARRSHACSDENFSVAVLGYPRVWQVTVALAADEFFLAPTMSIGARSVRAWQHRRGDR